jgi:hypothetical protein
MRELGSYLGHQPKQIDAEAEKRAARCQRGILVVSERDPRLAWPERELVRQLGTRLHGLRRVTSDG